MKLKTKTYCVMPWVCSMVNTDQNLMYCCISSDHLGGKYKAGRNSIIDDMWYSPEIERVRELMLNGEEVPGCEHCYMQERIGKESYRIMFSREWIEEDIHELPVYLDLRLGRKCNSKCRMCNPFNSTLFSTEHFDLYDSNERYRKIFSEQYGGNPEYLKHEDQWWESDSLWSELESMIPSIKKIYMTGGEPTLIKRNYSFLESCLRNGREDLFIFLNVNCTNIPDKLLDILKGFKRIKINASIDGIGGVNEYIRYPSKWDMVDRNFRRLAKMKHIDLGISPVILMYNILYLNELFEYVDEIKSESGRNINIDFLINTKPSYFDIRILPENCIEMVKSWLEALKHDTDNSHYHYLINVASNFLSLKFEGDKEKELSDFVYMTKLYDQYRKQSLRQSLPELYNLLRLELGENWDE